MADMELRRGPWCCLDQRIELQGKAVCLRSIWTSRKDMDPILEDLSRGHSRLRIWTAMCILNMALAPVIWTVAHIRKSSFCFHLVDGRTARSLGHGHALTTCLTLRLMVEILHELIYPNIPKPLEFMVV